MRISVNTKNKNQIETNPHLSKYNNSSRANYSMETTILEKYLICNYSKFLGKIIAHNITDS